MNDKNELLGRVKLANDEDNNQLDGSSIETQSSIICGELTSHKFSHKEVDCNTGKKGTVLLFEWLRENWTNPYPDDIDVSKMVNITGENSKKVCHWLQNNRSRKWREAMLASLGRVHRKEINVSEMKDDSLSLFDRLGDADVKVLIKEGKEFLDKRKKARASKMNK